MMKSDYTWEQREEAARKISALFDAVDDDEFLKFGKIMEPAHPCPDVCAFIMLSKVALTKAGRDLIGWAGHDEIALDVDEVKLAEVATPDLIRDLARCGVRWDADCLKMFV